jgi:hypothetical protein
MSLCQSLIKGEFSKLTALIAVLKELVFLHYPQIFENFQTKNYLKI